MMTDFAIGLPGLAALGGLALIAAVIILAVRNRAGRRALAIVASLAAGVIAGMALLANFSSARSRTVAVNPALTVNERGVVLDAQVEYADDTASTTSSVCIVADAPLAGAGVSSGRQVNVWVSRVTMLAALAVMVSLAYVFVDAGRRGRYTWPLRVGSAAAFALLCVLIGRLGPLM